MGWLSKEEENPTYDYFEEQAKLMGITASSNLEDMLPMVTGALTKFSDDPNLAKTGMKYAYDIQNPFKKTALNLMAGEGNVEDVLAGMTISDLQGTGDDPFSQAKSIGPILSQGENLGAQGNTTGVYGGVPQLISLIDKISGSSTQDLQGFLGGLSGLLGLGGSDIERIVDKVDDEDPTIWT